MRTKVRIVKELTDVDTRLAELRLSRQGLIAAGSRAVSASSDAGPLAAAIAPGMLKFLSGVEGLREENLGMGWTVFSKGGLEGIFNEDLDVVILYQSVYVCCSDNNPQPVSPKGSGSERLNHPSLFDRFDVEAPELVVIKDAKTKVYYLMVDPNGAMELSLPVIENRKFATCAERIFLIEGGDVDTVKVAPTGAPDQGQDDLVIEVKRKNER